MANAAKNKGDRFEREAVVELVRLAPDLTVVNPMRMLGAGRKDDIGDLSVFGDTAIQVRAYQASNLGGAARSAAYDSVTQADNGRLAHALGMVPIPKARVGTVRWLAAVAPHAWPFVLPSEPIEFKIISKAIPWLRDDDGPYGYEAKPRDHRIAILTGPADNVLLAPIEAWIRSYRIATTGQAGGLAAA